MDLSRGGPDWLDMNRFDIEAEDLPMVPSFA